MSVAPMTPVRELVDPWVPAAVLLRDGRCRWPAPHVCAGGLRVVAIGPTLTVGSAVTVCAWVACDAPASLGSGDLELQAETAAGGFGPVSGWRRAGAASYCVGRELAPGVLEHD